MTVFAGDVEDCSKFDEEAAQLWKKVTSISPDRILACGKKDNFWEMGSTGPCGPCSEIHIDLGPDRCDMQHVHGHKCEVNAGCARYIELWNLVFIQYDRQEDGSLVKLPARYIDTGAGLERITAVLQNKKSNYDTDLFMPIIDAIAELTGHKYTSELGDKVDNAFRVISDHIRSLTFSIADGVIPSNDGRGYVMRRLLRRGARFGRILDMHEPFMYKLVDVVSDVMGEAFGEVKERADFIKTVIKSEEESFGRTLDRGLEIFAQAAKKAEKKEDKTISGADVFRMYDTYGFPLDLTQLMARERGLSVDTVGFGENMEQQRERARAGQKTISLKGALSGVELPATRDSDKYHHRKCQTKILGWIDKTGFVTKGSLSDSSEEAALVLDATCFYAESGGQVGDFGTIESPTGKFIVENTEKIADCVIHKGKMVSGQLTAGDQVSASVDIKRFAVTKNHTATHLLQWALQQVLGDTVRQQGSLVSQDYLRFDFTFPKSLTDTQVEHVEKLVTEKIAQSHPVTCHEMSIDQAKKLGAMALFGEKYGSQVRVVAIGADDASQINEAFSKEFCGGIHVDNTSQISGFKIVKEESISAGVRRITALTGEGLNAFLLERSESIDALCRALKVPSDQIVDRVAKLLKDNKKLAKELKQASKQGGVDVLSEARGLLDNAEKIGDASIITGQLSAGGVDQARDAIDMLKKKAKSAAIVLGLSEGEDKAMLLCGVTDDLIKKGVKAGDIIKQIAPIVGGGGGGRPQMAQAGGKEPAKLDEALTKAAELIKSKLS